MSGIFVYFIIIWLGSNILIFGYFGLMWWFMDRPKVVHTSMDGGYKSAKNQLKEKLNNQRKGRICLRCFKEFQSTGPSNRICKSCEAKE